MYIVYTPGFLFAFPCIRGRGLGTRLQQLPSPGVKLALRVDVETLVATFAVGEHPEITQHDCINTCTSVNVDIYNVHVNDTNHHVVSKEYATADSTVSTWLGLISAVQHTHMYNVPLVPQVHRLPCTYSTQLRELWFIN